MFSSYSQNPCGVTRCLYLKVITSVVEYICKEKTVRDISHQARARLHNVILEANRCLLQNTAQCHVGREKLATAEVVICKTKLCLLAALYSEDLQCFDIEVQEVLTRSLQHTEPLVRCHALEIINSSQKEVVSFCPHVLQLLQDEGDECVIVQVSNSGVWYFCKFKHYSERIVLKLFWNCFLFQCLIPFTFNHAILFKPRSMTSWGVQ